MNQQQQQHDQHQPLHSESSQPQQQHSDQQQQQQPRLSSTSANEFLRKRRRCRAMTHRQNNMLHRHSILVLVAMCITLLLSFNSTPVEAKFRLMPKKNNNNNADNKNNGNNKHNRNNLKKRKNGNNRRASNNNVPNRNKPDNMIVLQPRTKKEEQPQNLKLEATISHNEKGEKVLLLTQDSAAMVETAMQASAPVKKPKAKASQPNAKAQSAPQKTQSESEETTSQVLFYDPEDLTTEAGEPPLPKRVFDEDGNEVDMAGKHAVLVHPPHPPHDPEEGGDNDDDGSNTKSSSSGSNNSNTSRTILLTPAQTHDQMIIITTVATMAVLVGVLSARRLRSRQFLSFCIENESLEDELAYDAAYTTQSTVGASSIYAGGGYDTFASGKGQLYAGDLRWRGDLEKFDV